MIFTKLVVVKTKGTSGLLNLFETHILFIYESSIELESWLEN